ncbi:diacylglycerol/lipid kinase family protein [Mucilaginibacter sp. KACC 22063]|uniref:diacylglycerol/lipid kinase family protein n=1 Tax=Mucilaginibacter sp. KACC 22063 TaxID=3025666 RepID=UPI00236652B0|nr:diacylglycerol kinase family protein [Mucilaginibacter sp. KACC 22063]WDF55143.1 diacylglycerol kinase family lipid kinase [Mucilaginibacter sp. KACC 22063]
MKKKLLFIINPVAGGKRKDKVPALIDRYLDKSIFDYDIKFTEAQSQASVMAAEAIDHHDIIVAVGGDGTVNEIASALAGSKAIFGIIPFGSGNGLSRFLHIPMDTAEAIKTLNSVNTETIDGAKINGQWFFNMAGMGFDAHISEVFSHQKTRGFTTYFKSSVKEITTYKSQVYHLDIDGKQYEREAFMLSFANSSQYGNNAHVSPHASVQDGLLDVCVIKPFPLYRFPEMGLRMFTGTADKSDYVEIIKGRHIEVKREEPGPVHLDGEPQMLGTEAEIEVVPHILKVIVGSTFNGKNNGR